LENLGPAEAGLEVFEYAQGPGESFTEYLKRGAFPIFQFGEESR